MHLRRGQEKLCSRQSEKEKEIPRWLASAYPGIYGPAWHVAEMRKKGWENGDIARVMPKAVSAILQELGYYPEGDETEGKCSGLPSHGARQRLPRTWREAMVSSCSIRTNTVELMLSCENVYSITQASGFPKSIQDRAGCQPERVSTVKAK